MIFKQWEQVLDGSKTQTRRIIKSNELASGSRGGGRHEIHAVWIDTKGIHDRRHEIFGFIRSPLVILESLYRLKWAVAQGFFVDKTYAVQPGRGKKAIGRIRITAIRRERVQDITPEDALAEGIEQVIDKGGGPLHPTTAYRDYRPNPVKIGGLGAVASFGTLWDSINKKPGTRVADNPEVWVLEFEVVR